MILTRVAPPGTRGLGALPEHEHPVSCGHPRARPAGPRCRSALRRLQVSTLFALRFHCLQMTTLHFTLRFHCLRVTTLYFVLPFHCLQVTTLHFALRFHCVRGDFALSFYCLRS